MKMLTFQLLFFLGASLLINVPVAKAGPLADKYAQERASAVAGALVGQQSLHSFNPASPFLGAYRNQYLSHGSVQTPLISSQLALAKVRLLWEYGPLSGKALSYASHLNEQVMAVAFEKPELLMEPEGLHKEIMTKVRNLSTREAAFKGNQGEVREAGHRGWQLVENPRDEHFDLRDPVTGKRYQVKIWKTGDASLRELRGDYHSLAEKSPKDAVNYRGMLPKDQIDELVAKGRLLKSSAPIEVGTRAGIRKQTAYFDPDTGTRIIALESEATAKEFAVNVRKGNAVYERLSQRSAGFGSAVAGGAVIGGGISLIAQKMLGRDVSWEAVGRNAAISAVSGGAAVLAAQTIERHFGDQLAKSMLARKFFPAASRSIARRVLSRGLGSAGGGVVVTLGFVAKDYYSGEISTTDTLVQSGVGLTSVGVGLWLTWATAGSLLGSEVPILGNAVGFAVGTAVYVIGSLYYENFKAEKVLAETKAFNKAAAQWQLAKLEQELSSLKIQAGTLRSEAARLLSN